MRHCGFSYKDVFAMTGYERKKFLELRQKEAEKEQEEMKKIDKS